MAMPLPTPVVPRRSRSSSTSKICRSDSPETSAARFESSCRACFLLVARNRGMTLAGVSNSSISIVSSASNRAPGRMVPLRIDPADVSVWATIDHVEPAMGPVAKHDSAAIGEVEAHHRLADPERRHLGGHLGDDGRGVAGAGLVRGRCLVACRQDVLLRRLDHDRLAMMIAQPALVAPQPLAEMLGGAVE